MVSVYFYTLFYKVGKMKNREYYYYGAEIYGTEKWEEIRKNKT